jgi:hypothetical protein
VGVDVGLHVLVDGTEVGGIAREHDHPTVTRETDRVEPTVATSVPARPGRDEGDASGREVLDVEVLTTTGFEHHLRLVRAEQPVGAPGARRT